MDNNEASTHTVLSTPGQKDVPSSEWASSTLKALGPVTAETYPADRPYQANYPSIPPTPSDQFPGAYPRGPIDPQALSQDVEYVKEAAAHVIETAKEYAYSAGEAVGRYLPKSVAPYLPRNGNASQHHHINGLEDGRSEELPGPHGEFLSDAQIPGDVGPSLQHSSKRSQEENVLLVPDNVTSGGRSYINTADQQSTAASSRFQGASENASTRSLPGSRADPWNYTPGTSLRGYSRRDADDSLKTSFSASEGLVTAQNAQPVLDDDQERRNSQTEKRTSELGDSRPPPEEGTESAKVLPIAESADPQSAGLDISSATTTGRQYATTLGSSISSSSKPSPWPNVSLASNVATPGHGRTRTFSSIEQGRAQEHVGDVAAHSENEASVESPGDAKNVPFSSNDTHQSDSVTSEDRTSPAVNAGVNEPLKKTASRGISHTSHGPTSSTSGDISTTEPASMTQTPSKSKFGSTNRKPGFMDKLRGEIKIISGKLEHSNDKIEEGRRLMGKVSKSKH